MGASAPRIAYIDIETAPILATVWELHEANAVWVERDTYMLCFSVLWSGEKRAKTYSLPDYPGYKKNKHNDYKLVADLNRVLSSADIVIAHNGDNFDIKKIRSRLIVHKFKPPPPFKTIDTLKLARRTFKFDSNKLDNLGRYLGCGRKIPNTGAALWRGCVNGDMKSWRRMKAYNAQDVYLLERVYHKLRSWSDHVDLRLYDGSSGCPTCKSKNVIRQGSRISRTRKYQRLQCQACGFWFSGDLIK